MAIGSRFGIVGILVALGLYFGSQFLLGGSERSPLSGQAEAPAAAPAADEGSRFVGFVLDDVQSSWQRHFADMGKRYVPAKLVLFTDSTSTACGYGSAAMGPFYCPGDQRVFIDLGFFRELDQRFGAPGDFAQAYVIAHEIGHHVQNLLGLSGKVRGAANRDGAEGASVRLELQADCFAGVWAHSSEQRALLDPGDIDEGLAAAAAIGDDRLQRRSTGTVNPETWTHGSAEQRSRWLRRGLTSGKPEACDTQTAATL